MLGMFSGFMIPVLIVFIGFVFFAAVVLVAKCYHVIPPNMVAIVTGKKSKNAKGEILRYRIFRGGSVLVWPIKEKIQFLPLTLMTLDVEAKEAYNKDGVPIDLDAVANIKIKSEDSAISNAVERFLEDPKKIPETAKKTLEGHLRAIIGTLSIEELNGDRQAFIEKVTTESVADLEKMGLGVDSIVIHKIEDKLGYLSSLGKKRTAEVVRDAEISEAIAKAESKKQSKTSLREAELIAAENTRQVEEAQKNLNVKKAEYQAEVNKQMAITEQIGLLAKAVAEKDTMVAQQAAKEAEAEASVKVKTQEAARMEQELLGTMVRQAEAKKMADIATAEGEKQSSILKAEAKKESAVREAEGLKEAAMLEAQGIQAKLEAQAAGDKAKLLAEAEGTRAKLNAEAEGIQKKADAMKSLEASAQLLLLMEKSPEVIKAIGDAGGEIARGVFQSIAAPLGGIDHLTVYDSSNGDGHGALSRVANIVPGILFEFLTKCKANGMTDLGDLVTGGLKMLAASTQKEQVEKGNSHDNSDDVSVGG